MYSFQFVHINNPNKNIFLFATDYISAMVKLRKLGSPIPDFNIKQWELEEIIEIEE